MFNFYVSLRLVVALGVLTFATACSHGFQSPKITSTFKDQSSTGLSSGINTGTLVGLPKRPLLSPPTPAAPPMPIAPTPNPAPPAPTPNPAPVAAIQPAVASCISTEVGINDALAAGKDVAICPNTTIFVHKSLKFTHNQQQIYTFGNPTDNSRAVITIDPSANSVSTIIESETLSSATVILDHISLHNLIIDGNASQMGVTNQCPQNPDGCHGLVNLAAVTSPQIHDNIIRYARTWAHIVLTENNGSCNAPVIVRNVVGPAFKQTTGVRALTWSDGISVNCQNAYVADNQVLDVTDGGIVLFAKQNVKVLNNTITAISAHMNLGISTTDWDTGNGNYSGSLISGNTISSNGALGGFIYVGIAVGNHLWYGTTFDNRTPKYNFGLTVTNNVLVGPGLGFGIAVSGADSSIITANQLNQTNIVVDPSNVTGTTLQPGYTSTESTALDSIPGREFFVLRLYRNLLSVNSPDPTGFLFWMTGLNPCTRQAGLSRTKEFILVPLVSKNLNSMSPRQLVTALFLTVLNRNPTDSEANAQVANMHSTQTNTEWALLAAEDFFSSTEYLQNSYNSCAANLNN